MGHMSVSAPSSLDRLLARTAAVRKKMAASVDAACKSTVSGPMRGPAPASAYLSDTLSFRMRGVRNTSSSVRLRTLALFLNR